MADYEYLGLNSQLNSVTSPANNQTDTIGYRFDAELERGAIRKSMMGTNVIGNAQIGTAVIGTANIGTLSFNQMSGGTITVLANLGTGNIKLDGANKQIIINDGTNDRILIGYQSGGF